MVVLMNFPQTLFRSRPAPMMEPTEDEAEEHLTEDERTLRLVEVEIHNTVGEPHARPLVWTVGKPNVPGWRHARKPGAAEFTVVCVQRGDDGELWFGVSAVTFQRVADSNLEWASAVIQDPH